MKQITPKDIQSGDLISVFFYKSTRYLLICRVNKVISYTGIEGQLIYDSSRIGFLSPSSTFDLLFRYDKETKRKYFKLSDEEIIEHVIKETI